MSITKLSLGVASVLASLAAISCTADSTYVPNHKDVDNGDGVGGVEYPDAINETIPPLGDSKVPNQLVPTGGGGTGGLGGAGSLGGAGGSGGAGGAAPPEPPINDGCLGTPVTLSPGFTVEIAGTLVGATDDLTTFCADTSPDPGNPDVVYQLDVTSDVTLNMQLITTDFNAALSLRANDCNSEWNGDACLDFGSTIEKKHVALGTGTYWVVVDSSDGNTGTFSLNLVATEPVCGDGAVGPGEECDPGVGALDDGCNDPGTANECTNGESPTNVDVTQCPGFGPVNVNLSVDPQNPTITRIGPNNNGAGAHSEMNEVTPDPNICGVGASGPENVFHVVPAESGTLFARIGFDNNNGIICDSNPNCGDFILYARQESCTPIVPADPLQQTACVDFDANFQEVLVIQFPVIASSDYWVFVDGLDDTWGIGAYYLELWMVP